MCACMCVGGWGGGVRVEDECEIYMIQASDFARNHALRISKLLFSILNCVVASLTPNLSSNHRSPNMMPAD